MNYKVFILLFLFLMYSGSLITQCSQLGTQEKSNTKPKALSTSKVLDNQYLKNIIKDSILLVQKLKMWMDTLSKLTPSDQFQNYKNCYNSFQGHHVPFVKKDAILQISLDSLSHLKTKQKRLFDEVSGLRSQLNRIDTLKPQIDEDTHRLKDSITIIQNHLDNKMISLNQRLNRYLKEFGTLNEWGQIKKEYTELIRHYHFRDRENHHLERIADIEYIIGSMNTTRQVFSSAYNKDRVDKALRPLKESKRKIAKHKLDIPKFKKIFKDLTNYCSNTKKMFVVVERLYYDYSAIQIEELNNISTNYDFFYRNLTNQNGEPIVINSIFISDSILKEVCHEK